MILWVALLMSQCCLSLNGAAAESTGLERIEKCATRCSQGLHCKPRANDLFLRPCQEPDEVLKGSPVFRNVSLSTVMSCQGRQKCSLHLRIQTVLQLSESIHGVSICTATPGMMMACRIFSFTKASRERMSGQEVEIKDDCTNVIPNQQVQVLVKTVPDYCDIIWTGTYDAPACDSEDLRRHVPGCITGRLSYEVDTKRKEMTVNVSDMLEDHNYYVRLCHKDFICGSTEAFKLIKKEEPVKSAVFPYSRPLPCLCIEGWSAVVDAPRVQVCPFKDRVEELWFGATFDPLEQTLSWEPACPVAAVVTLCHKKEDDVCVPLPHASQNVSREKITFTKVDPHPHLCIKFTTGSQSWTRCPYAEWGFKAWDLAVKSSKEVKIVPHTTAALSVRLCLKSADSSLCQITETHTLHVEKNTAVALNLTRELCGSCLQVKRLDVNYAIPVTHCFDQCSQPLPDKATFDLTWVFVSAGVCLIGIIIVMLVVHTLLYAYQSRKQKRHEDKKPKDPAVDSGVYALQTQPILQGGILIPDSPQCGNAEKAILIHN